MIATDQQQAIYRRWRAQTFAQVVGQEAVVTALRNAIRDGRLAHALLFAGPRGTGKTSVARIVAKALNCPNVADGEPCDACPTCVAIREGRALDVVELDAASNRGIDEVRNLRERLAYAPADLRRKVYILDEAHQITRDAWNALLKSIEEPPDFVAFIFASTHPQGFPPAILSRLQRYDFRRLTVAEIAGKLETILATEGRRAEADAIRLIAELAAGGMRDAETILDQLLATGLEEVRVEDVRALLGLADPETVEGLVRALVTGDPAAGLALLDGLEERGRDLRTLLDQVVDRLRRAMVDAVARGAPPSPLIEAARRLATIDPTASTPGGLRLQIELALLAGPGTGAETGDRTAAAPPGAGVGSVSAEAPNRSRPSIEPPTVPSRRSPMPRQPDGPDDGGFRPTGGAPPKAEVSVPAPSAPPVSDGSARRSAAEAIGRVGPARVDELANPAIDEVLRRWPEIVAHLSQRPPLRPLMVECRPIQVEGPTIVLGFPEERAFLREAAERRRQEIEAGMAAVLDRKVAVRCVATNLDGYPPLTLDPEGARILAEAKRIFGDDLVEVREIT